MLKNPKGKYISGLKIRVDPPVFNTTMAIQSVDSEQYEALRITLYEFGRDS